MTHLAEARSRMGDRASAAQLFSEAASRLEESATPWALAYLSAALAEMLRDAGRPVEATEAYRSAAAIVDGLGMEGWVAYYGLLLAETSLLAGREDDAIDAIIAVVPILERGRLQCGALAAMALLHESLRRQKADLETIRALRTQIQRVRQADHL